MTLNLNLKFTKKFPPFKEEIIAVLTFPRAGWNGNRKPFWFTKPFWLSIVSEDTKRISDPFSAPSCKALSS